MESFIDPKLEKYVDQVIFFFTSSQQFRNSISENHLYNIPLALLLPMLIRISIHHVRRLSVQECYILISLIDCTYMLCVYKYNIDIIHVKVK